MIASSVQWWPEVSAWTVGLIALVCLGLIYFIFYHGPYFLHRFRVRNRDDWGQPRGFQLLPETSVDSLVESLVECGILGPTRRVDLISALERGPIRLLDVSLIKRSERRSKDRRVAVTVGTVRFEGNYPERKIQPLGKVALGKYTAMRTGGEDLELDEIFPLVDVEDDEFNRHYTVFGSEHSDTTPEGLSEAVRNRLVESPGTFIYLHKNRAYLHQNELWKNNQLGKFVDLLESLRRIWEVGGPPSPGEEEEPVEVRSTNPKQSLSSEPERGV